MKKTFLRAAALTLVLVMAAALFAACGQDDGKLILGRWTATAEGGKYAAEDFEEYGEYLDGLDLSDITLKLYMEFKEDGTYTAEIDEESAKAAVDAMFERMKPAFADMMKKEMAESMEMDPEEMTDETFNSLLSMAGLGSMDDIFDSMKADMDPEEIFGDSSSSGKYMLKDGKLYMSDSPDEAADEETDCVSCKLTPATLTLDAAENEEVPEGLEDMLPITFTKLGE